MLNFLHKAQAAILDPGGLVPQPIDGKYNSCHLLELIDNVLDGLIQISFLLVTIMVIYGAFLIMTAGAKPENIETGKKTIKSAVIGIAIVLGAWLIIDTIVHFIGGGSIAPWSNLSCGDLIVL